MPSLGQSISRVAVGEHSPVQKRGIHNVSLVRKTGRALPAAVARAFPDPLRGMRGHLKPQSEAGDSLADAAGPGCLPGLQGQPGADATIPQCHGGGGSLLLRAPAARLRPAWLHG